MIPPNITVAFVIALLLTRIGVARELLMMAHILMRLRAVIENRDSCDPVVLITPKIEQAFPDNHCACSLQ